MNCFYISFLFSIKIIDLRIVLILLMLSIHGLSLMGQSASWTPWELLYSDNFVRVEISYKLSPNSCDQAGRPNIFRYNINGLRTDHDNYYVNWKMSYIDCFNKLRHDQYSVNIGAKASDGIVEFMDDQFTGTLESRFFEVTSSSKLKRGSELIGSAKSKDPQLISGNVNIYRGQLTELAVIGGVLGYQADWVWYVGGCGAKKLGTGEKIKVSPNETSTYFVRAEGKDSTKCVQITVTVDQRSTAPKIIIGNKTICRGDNAEISVSGGSLGLDAQWVWYADSCSGKPIGKGEKIRISPDRPTNYYVRAEGKLNITECASIAIAVTENSKPPTSITGMKNICEGEKIALTVNGGALAQGSTWIWYSGSCGGTRVASGTTVQLSPLVTTTYFVRAEGSCANTSCVSGTVNVSSLSQKPIRISSPSTVYKRKKIELTALGGRLGENSQWKWYKGECGGTKLVGTGQTISIKVKESATYYLRAEGKCNKTSCIETRLSPLKERRFHPSHSVNGFTNKSFQLGIGIGVDMMSFSALTKRTNYSSSGTITSQSSEELNIYGIGGKVELVMHPFIKEAFSIGLLAGYSAGTTPLIVIGGDRERNGKIDKEKYFYSRFELGTELAFGGKSIKGLALYRNSFHTHDYMKEVLSGSGILINSNSFEQSLRKETISAGFRFGSYSRYLKRQFKKGYSIDLTYNVSRDYPWAWNDFIWKYSALSNWQHGFGVGIWIQSAIKLQADVSLFNAILGSNSSTGLDDIKKSYYQVSLMYNRNGFY